MAKYLVIVESPAKSKTIEKYLAIFLACIAVFNIIRGEINIRIPYKNDSIANRYLEDSKIIESKTNNNDKIHIISQGNDGSSFFTLSYLTSPRKYNIVYFSLGKINKEDIFITDLTSKEFSNFLIKGSYKYLYMCAEELPVL